MNIKTLKIYQGLQASGKTTRAKEEISKNPKFRRVERDCLREMLFCQKFTGKPADEKLVTKIQQAIIKVLFDEGYNVISSDTNLSHSSISGLKKLAADNNAHVEYDKSFLDVPVEECVRRDLIRPNSVGEKVIRNFAAKYLPQPKKIQQDKSLPKAVIFDIDGTIAEMGERNPYDWFKIHLDTVHNHVANVMMLYYYAGYKIIFLSGRDSICRNETIKWLEEKLKLSYVTDFDLYMRSFNDNRKDSVVKKELFINNILDKYYVEVIYDDRAQVNRIWKELGINVFRCGIIDEDEF